MNQKILPLAARPRLPGESAFDAGYRKRELSEHLRLRFVTVPPEELFGRLLKRLARRAMQDATECQESSIGAHMSRCDDLIELTTYALNHDLVQACESEFSGKQLMYPVTLRDLLACLDHTKKHHRAPAYLNARDTVLEEVNRKLDLIAGLLANSPAIEALLSQEVVSLNGGEM